jgi:glycosyltransferase involved in cell wall biosynthesis
VTCRLLFLLNDAPFFVTHRLPLAAAAVKAGYEVHVAVPYDEQAVAAIRAAGVVHHDVPLQRGARAVAGELRLIGAYWRLVRALKPDVLHAVTMKPVLYGGLVARFAGVPAAVHAITGLGYLFLIKGALAGAQRAFVKALYRFALAHPNVRAIFQNPDDLAVFEDDRLVRPGTAVMIRGCGVDTDVFAPAPEPSGAPIVLFPARIIGDKGVREFVGAARLLKEEGIDAVFRIAGRLDPDNPTDVGEAAVRRWQDDGWIEWAGFVTAVPDAFAACHVVCLPSHREGLPRALIEAAACGRPIVTTDVPGCREVVRDGDNGLLVPVSDERAVAGALRTLIEAGDLRERMGRRGRERALDEFTVEGFVAASLAVYRTVTAS